MKEFKDEYVAVEHILIGILNGKDKTAGLLKDIGFAEKQLKLAILELRGGTKVTDQHAENTYQSLKKYSKFSSESTSNGTHDQGYADFTTWLKFCGDTRGECPGKSWGVSGEVVGSVQGSRGVIAKMI